MKINIACVKWGNKYSSDYVNRLYSMIQRNFSLDHNFICFTDNPKEINKNIEIKLLPTLLEGWYNKLYLFKEGLMKGKVIYFDLDTIILKNIDELANYQGDLALLNDFNNNTLATGIMIWKAEKNYKIWEKYKEMNYPKYFNGDGQFFNDNYDADKINSFFNGILSFKNHCKYRVPINARIVCFHGKPKNHEVKDHEIYKYWS